MDLISVINSIKEREKTAVILMGIPASGKSTFYRKYFSDSHVHINLDTLHTRNKENILFTECLDRGSSLVVDNTNPKVSDRERYIPRALEAGYEVYGFLFRGNITDCKLRNAGREGKSRVPDKAITAISSAFEYPRYDEGFGEIYFILQNDGGFEATEYICD
ncbi:MAG: AAA family ATPase [Clostridia bacterium]|nr:AAA family ATPase [Clostridia bacterium]